MLESEKISIFPEKQPFSGTFFSLRRFAGDDDDILADHLNFLPWNNIIFPISEYSEEEISVKYYKSYNIVAFCFHNNVINVTYSHAVGGADYLLVPEVCETAIHSEHLR